MYCRTAQGRIAISGGSTSGAYAASPITVTGATAGQTMTVEFNAGTLSKVQLEPGAAPTPFEREPYPIAFERCKYWLEILKTAASTSSWFPPQFIAFSAAGAQGSISFSQKAAVPTITLDPASSWFLLQPGVSQTALTAISVVSGTITQTSATIEADTAGALATNLQLFLSPSSAIVAKVVVSAEL